MHYWNCKVQQKCDYMLHKIDMHRRGYNTSINTLFIVSIVLMHPHVYNPQSAYIFFVNGDVLYKTHAFMDIMFSLFVTPGE